MWRVLGRFPGQGLPHFPKVCSWPFKGLSNLEFVVKVEGKVMVDIFGHNLLVLDSGKD